MSWLKRKGLQGIVALRDSKGVSRLYCFTRKSVLEYDPDTEVWRVISTTVAKEIMK